MNQNDVARCNGFCREHWEDGEPYEDCQECARLIRDHEKGKPFMNMIAPPVIIVFFCPNQIRTEPEPYEN